MSDKRYFLFDCETGGLKKNSHSLLTLYGVVLDSNLDALASIDLKIKPTGGIYHVDIEAMKVNKIDLLKHDTVATPTRDASVQLRDFLFRHTTGGCKLTPAGHNINLDVRFTTKFCPEFRSLCDRRWLDTAAIGQYLQLTGKVPATNNGSLAQLCKHYGIDSSKNHDAQADVEMTHLLLKAMVKDGLTKP